MPIFGGVTKYAQMKKLENGMELGSFTIERKTGWKVYRSGCVFN